MDPSETIGRGLAVVATIAGTVVALAGCATPARPLAKDAASQMHTIAVLDVQEPTKYGAENVYLEGVFMGGLVNIRHGDQFTAALRERGFELSDEMTRCLAKGLAAAGFGVERVRAERKPMQAAVVAHGDTKADVLLNVSLGGGYVSPHGIDDYVPTLGTVAQLLENRTGKEAEVYRQRFAYGSGSPLGTAIRVEALPGYRYGSFDGLVQQSAEAGEGLRRGAVLICDAIVRDIAGQRN